MVWVRRAGEIHSTYLMVPSQDVRRAAENLIGECSRPDSDLSNLRADAQYLYKWLIQPVERWLPPSGHVIVEPDGILGVVPLEALIDSDGSYLGARYAITIASSVIANDELSKPLSVEKSDPALIAVAPTGTSGAMRAASGAVRESLRVAARFTDPVLLAGADVQVFRVGRELPRSTVFHFAGHAGLSRSGAAMLMADGILGADQARAFEGQKLSRLKLAVFSACGTAKSSEISDSDTLVTAFLQAGAQNVVASRWNVDSVATTGFVDLFYGSLLSGASVPEALHGAATAFRKMPERTHPYYWAAFAAFGRA
jgi:CHAT domain-containing protein